MTLMAISDLLKVETTATSPVRAGDLEITPVARAWRLKVPGWKSGIVWSHPRSVEVKDSGGRERKLPVRNSTRLIQLAICSGAVVTTIAVKAVRKKAAARKRG